jgi:hypothetical protein
MKITEFHEIGSLNFIRYLLTLHSFMRIKITVRVILYAQDFFDYSLIIDNQQNRLMPPFSILNTKVTIGLLVA